MFLLGLEVAVREHNLDVFLPCKLQCRKRIMKVCLPLLQLENIPYAQKTSFSGAYLYALWGIPHTHTHTFPGPSKTRFLSEGRRTGLGRLGKPGSFSPSLSIGNGYVTSGECRTLLGPCRLSYGTKVATGPGPGRT